MFKALLLERGGRCGGQPYARQCPGADALRRHRRRLRPGPGLRAAGNGDAIHPSQSPFRRARSARQPQRVSPTPQPLCTKRSPSLRGVTLAGIDSVIAPIALRRQAWERLGRDLDAAALELISEEIPLEQAIEKAEALMRGQVRSRIVVRLSASTAAGA